MYSNTVIILKVIYIYMQQIFCIMYTIVVLLFYQNIYIYLLHKLYYSFRYECEGIWVDSSTSKTDSLG